MVITPGLDGQSVPLAASDLAIDALLGLGASRAPNAAMAEAISRLIHTFARDNHRVDLRTEFIINASNEAANYRQL